MKNADGYPIRVEYLAVGIGVKATFPQRAGVVSGYGCFPHRHPSGCGLLVARVSTWRVLAEILGHLFRPQDLDGVAVRVKNEC